MSRSLKVKIVRTLTTNLASMFYIKASVSLCEKLGLTCYETVILANPSNPKLMFAGNIQYDTKLSGDGLVVSRQVLAQLQLEQTPGQKIQVNLLTDQLIPVCNKCQLQLIEQERSQELNPDKAVELQIKSAIKYNALVSGQILEQDNYKYRVRLTPSVPFAYVGAQTKIIFSTGNMTPYSNCIGLQEPLQQLMALIQLPLKYPQKYQRLKLKPPRGVLLYGPPGCGKTHLVRQISKICNRHFFSCSGPQLIDKYVGQSQRNLRNLFSQAKKNAPSIIFIDQMDSIAARRDQVGVAEHQRRLVGQLLTCLDGLDDRGQVLVIGATNLLENIDPACRRPSRFDKEVRINPPTQEQRRRLLDYALKGTPHTIDLNALATKMTGYTPADIILFCQQIKKETIMRSIENPDQELVVTEAQVSKVYNYLRPTTLRGYYGAQEYPSTLDSIAGYQDVKQRIVKQLVTPLKYGYAYKNAGMSLPRGILLYGPPGTGKTTLAKGIAKSLNYSLMVISAPELRKQLVGSSEKMVRDLFSKARGASPTVVVIDQIDAVCGKKLQQGGYSSSVMSQILSQMDGLRDNQGVIIVGTTNHRELLDPALLRAGRFDLQIQMGYPDAQALEAIFIKKTSNLQFQDRDLCLRNLKQTGLIYRFTGSQVSSVVRGSITNSIAKTDPQDLKQKQKSKETPLIDKKSFKDALDQIVRQRRLKGSITHAY